MLIKMKTWCSCAGRYCGSAYTLQNGTRFVGLLKSIVAFLSIVAGLHYIIMTTYVTIPKYVGWIDDPHVTKSGMKNLIGQLKTKCLLTWLSLALNFVDLVFSQFLRYGAKTCNLKACLPWYYYSMFWFCVAVLASLHYLVVQVDVHLQPVVVLVAAVLLVIDFCMIKIVHGFIKQLRAMQGGNVNGNPKVCSSQQKQQRKYPVP